MVSRSSDKTESVRVTAAESDAARAAVEAHGWDLPAAFRAFVLALADRPTEFLRLLAPYRREPKKAGRPRKTTE